MALTLAVAAMLCLIPAPGSAAAGTDHSRIMDLAAQADRARENRRQLLDAWSAEEARLSIVLQALQAEQLRLQERHERLTAERIGLASRLEQAAQANELRARLDQQVAAMADRIAAAIAQAQSQTALGLHSAGADDQDEPPIGALQALEAAFASLATAETQARQVVRRRLSGRLPDGSRRGVEVLAIGGAAAWWLGADGEAGTATVVDGELLLHPAAGDTDRIRELFHVHAGERPADLLAVPLPSAGESP